MDILVYITGFTAIVAVICLVMLMNLRSAVAPAEGGSTSAAAAAPARAAAPAAAPVAAPAPAADNGAVVAAIAAAIACMEGGEVASIRLAQKNTGWTTAARIAGAQQNF